MSALILDSKHEVLASNDADAADDYAPIEDTDFNVSMCFRHFYIFLLNLLAIKLY